MGNYYFTLTNKVNKIVSKQRGLLEDASASPVHTEYYSATSCLFKDKLCKLRYFMGRGKVWTCNIIYIDMFPKYWNLLTNMMLNYWNTPLNYWNAPLNNDLFLVRGATASPRNGRVMPPCLSTRFGKATLHPAPHNEGKTHGGPAGGTLNHPEGVGMICGKARMAPQPSLPL